MQPIVLPLAIAMLGAADAPVPAEAPSFDLPLAPMRELSPDLLAGERCRDRNLPAGDNPARQPRLERGPATPGMGQIIYAVDHRVDGCSVVLVKGAPIQPRRDLPLPGRR